MGGAANKQENPRRNPPCSAVKNVFSVFPDTRQRTDFYVFLHATTPPKRAPPRCAACASGGHRPTARAARARHLAGGVVHAHVPTPRAMTAPTAHGTNEIAQRNSAKNRAATQPRNDASEFNNRSNSSGASACSSRGTDAATTSCRPRRRPRSQPATRPAISARNDLRFLPEQPGQPEQNGNNSADKGRISRITCLDQRV